jgi:hypothetical protein
VIVEEIPDLRKSYSDPKDECGDREHTVFLLKKREMRSKHDEKVTPTQNLSWVGTLAFPKSQSPMWKLYPPSAIHESTQRFLW